jgi:hypothetical protein
MRLNPFGLDTQHHHRRRQLAHLQTIYSDQLTVIQPQRITINQFFSTIQISLYKPRRYRGIQTMDFVNEIIGQYWKAKIEEVSA